MKPVVIKRFLFEFLPLGAISTLVYLNAFNHSKYKEDRREFKEEYSLSTLKELKEKCKIDKRWPTFNSSLEYEVHMNEKLCDAKLFPNRYKVQVCESKDNFGNRVFDLEIIKYLEYFYNGKEVVEATITDVISGNVYELKEIMESNVLDIGEITVTFDYFTTYKWLPLEKCEGKFR